MHREGLSAGWAEVDVTPELGTPLGGRGPVVEPAERLHDPLKAQAVVIRDAAGGVAVVIAIDIIGLTHHVTRTIRQRVADLTGAKVEHVLINFSHTHSGALGHWRRHPWSDEDRAAIEPALQAYQAALEQRLVACVKAAWERVRPAQWRWCEGRTHIAMNRRARDERGEMAIRPNDAGPYRSELVVWEIEQDRGDRLVVAAAGCHPVIMVAADRRCISADYPGRFRELLKAGLGDHTEVMFLQGLTGDSRPRVLRDEDGRRFRPGTPADVTRVAQQLAADVCATLGQEGEVIEPRFAGTEAAVTLPRTGEMLSEAELRAMRESDAPLSRALGTHWTQVRDRGEQPAKASDWPMGLLAVDAAHVVGWIAGEPVSQWYEVVRQALGPEPRLVVLGYCCDMEGYLPMDAMLAEGGYEPIQANLFGVDGPSPFRPELEQRVGEAMRELAEQVGVTPAAEQEAS